MRQVKAEPRSRPDPFKWFDLKLAPAMTAAVDACRELLEGRRWCVFLIGGYGIGKTHLARSCRRAWIDFGENRQWAEFENIPDLLARLRVLQLDDVHHLEARIHKFQTHGDLVVLDDLGTENQSPWTREVIYRIIDARYESRLPTLATSNARIQDLDPRVVSRLEEGKVVCSSPDMRGKL